MPAHNHVFSLALMLLAGGMIPQPAFCADSGKAEGGEKDRSFLEPPQVVTATPGPEYAAEQRKFQGIPSLARAPQGRLWAIWYASRSGGEDENNYVVVYTSGDDGRSWGTPALVIDPDREGPVPHSIRRSG